MKKVKYIVNSDFALNQIGDILDSYLIAKDEDINLALLFHPYVHGYCLSFEIGRFLRKDKGFEYYTGQNGNTIFSWINFAPHAPIKFEKKLLKLLKD